MSEPTFVVTHCQAADSDPRKVAAALEVWQLGLAEKVIESSPVPEAIAPVAIRTAPRRRPARTKQVPGTPPSGPDDR